MFGVSGFRCLGRGIWAVGYLDFRVSGSLRDVGHLLSSRSCNPFFGLPRDAEHLQVSNLRHRVDV